ncbi:MAG TPA: OsmC family protein [Bacteroidia bacterium]|jgi:putative redox protein|nr:OsmC family protein [Bacteroidia bacterium]
MKVTLNRIDDAFQFEAKDANGKTVVFDASPKIGGKGNGVSPMQTLIMAAGGCSAIDVILILRKQKQEIHDFKIEIDGEREPDKEPSLWQTVHLLFKLEGTIDGEKAKRAVQLSMEKYCSVVKTLEGAGAKISWDVVVNGTTI